MEIVNNLNGFFSQTLNDLPCQDDTKAYIIGIFSKYRSQDFDLSKDNLTLLYAQAHFNQDFLVYQTLGDWIFYAKTMHPTHLTRASEDYYYNLGRLSYHSCYRLINRQWKLFEQLADEYEPLVEASQELIFNPLK